MQDEKVAENRARRALDRRGLRLQKRRRNDPKVASGGFMIIDPARSVVLAGGGERPYSLALADVEEWLKRN